MARSNPTAPNRHWSDATVDASQETSDLATVHGGCCDTAVRSSSYIPESVGRAVAGIELHIGGQMVFCSHMDQVHEFIDAECDC